MECPWCTACGYDKESEAEEATKGKHNAERTAPDEAEAAANRLAKAWDWTASQSIVEALYEMLKLPGPPDVFSNKQIYDIFKVVFQAREMEKAGYVIRATFLQDATSQVVLSMLTGRDFHNCGRKPDPDDSNGAQRPKLIYIPYEPDDKYWANFPLRPNESLDSRRKHVADSIVQAITQSFLELLATGEPVLR